MNQDRRRRLIVWGILVTVVACVSICCISVPQSPLTLAERSLVGTWTYEDRSIGIVFSADRSFRDDNDEFCGRWWMEAGQLKMKMWRTERMVSSYNRLNRFARPLTNAWDSFNARIDSCEIEIDNDSAELSWSNIEPTRLIRSEIQARSASE